MGELLGFELLNEIQNELLEEFPDTILIAEPWSFRGRLTENMNQTKFSLWSDSCREELFKFVSALNGPQNCVEEIRNTYQREDLNALNYDLSDSAESFHQWTKSLVSFRLSKEGKNFCLKEFLHDTQYEVFKGVKDCFALLIYNQPNIKSGDALIIIINATKSESFIAFPANIKNSGFEKILGEECSELGNIPPLSLQIWKTV